LSRFVVPGLPNADDSAIRLNLVDIGAGNPNLLRRVNWSRHNRRRDNRRSHDSSRDNRSRDDAWADYCVSQNATDNPADEARPEMTPSVSPPAMVVMMHRRWAMMHHRRRSPAKATMMAKAAARTAKARASHKRSCRQDRAKCKYKFLVHVCLSFLRFCGHVKIGHETNKN